MWATRSNRRRSPRTPTSGSISPTRKVDDSYANGYGNSKWAGEVLLREANDLCGLPVAVFRCDMILADTTYAGQLNVPDMFTRLMLSLVATGIAPGSFYELDADGNRQRAHYDGLPVDFIAEAISTLGAQVVDGFETYHVMNPYDDGIGLDEYVDWLIDAGYPIQRIPDYDAWLQRFETAMRALPDTAAPGLAAAAAAQLPATGEADPRVDGAHRPVPRGGAGGENRPGQRHPTRHGADHRQVHHRPAAARTAMRRPRSNGCQQAGIDSSCRSASATSVMAATAPNLVQHRESLAAPAELGRPAAVRDAMALIEAGRARAADHVDTGDAVPRQRAHPAGGLSPAPTAHKRMYGETPHQALCAAR